jgi:hypothetical protein
VSSTTEGARARRNRMRAAITTAAALVAAAAFGGSAQAAISVSPDIHPNGFPKWYADTSGNQLGLCVDDTALCPGDPPFTTNNLKGPDGEAFYYLASSEDVPAAGGTVNATLAVEAAFGDDTTPNVFTRIRFTFSKTAARGDYEIKYPWGTETVTNDGAKNQGVDIGCFAVLNTPCDFTLPTLGPIKNWLKASNAPTDASGKLIAYGDGATVTTVTGGNVEDVISADGTTITPTEVNSLTVTGPDGKTASTDLWTVMGKLFDPTAPVLNPPAPPAPRPNPKPPVQQGGDIGGSTTTGGATTIIRVIPGPASAVLGSQASSALSVSRLTLARRISVTRLRGQGLRGTMNVQEGTNVVRFAIYKARGGQKTGRALYTTTRTPTHAGLFRFSLASAKLAKLKPGRYVTEVRAGRSAASLVAVKTFGFTVTR